MLPRLVYGRLLLIASVVFLLDQATKLWIIRNLDYGSFYPPDCIQVIPGWFHIVHVGNTGAAWSLFSGHSEILAIIGFVALALLFFFRKALELDRPLNQVVFGLIVGGILGNVLDRIRIGHVVDFLDFHYKHHHFPAFNIADSGLTVGVGIYVISVYMLPAGNAKSAD